MNIDDRGIETSYYPTVGSRADVVNVIRKAMIMKIRKKMMRMIRRKKMMKKRTTINLREKMEI